MSIFRRKPSVDPSEVTALRDELAGMQALLASAVASRKAVEQRLSELEAELKARAEAAAETEAAASTPPPPPPAVSLDEVKAIAEHAAQLAAQADEGVRGLNDLVASSTHHAADDHADTLAALQAQVAQLAEQVSATQAEARHTQALVSSVEVRLSQLGNELTDQIDELAGEIEDTRRACTAAGTGADPTVIEQLRMGQVRLANEQARYEIAFRADLAHLADQLLRRSA